MKGNRFRAGILVCGFLLSQNPILWAQSRVTGTEEAASYGKEKDRILAREERIRRSQVIQDAARTYRQMVAAYKANRILHAEEMSQQLDVLLEDPLLPLNFAERLRTKQDIFLRRVYGGVGRTRMDVPEDDISDEEFARIRGAVQSRGEKDVSVSRSVPEDDTAALPSAKKSAGRSAPKKRNSFEDVEARRQNQIARREAERQSKEALKRKKAVERAERAAQRKADREGQKTAKDDLSRRYANLQSAALELKQDEVDRYVRLYREDLQKEREALKQEFSAKIDSLYHDGLEYYRKNAYQFAHDVFLEVEKLHPDYKMTRHYLSELKEYFRLRSLGISKDRVVADALDAF